MNTRILLIEDDPILGPIEARFLRQQGYLVTGPLADALDLSCQAQPQRYDLAIVDLSLAGEASGLDLLPVLRRDYADRILVCSAVQDPDIVSLCAHLGAHSFLQKPFIRQQLLSQVHFLLQQKTPQQGPTAEHWVSFGQGLDPILLARINENLARQPKYLQDVFALLVDQKSDREIAAALGLSLNSARTYVHRLLKNLDLHNRQHCTHIASLLSKNTSVENIL